jgi:hypothetical protein
MFKTLEEMQNLSEGTQKNAWYELYHLNTQLNKQGKKVEILKMNGLTYHLKVTIQPIEENEFSWYSVTNTGTEDIFKNWAEVYQYLHGMRMVFYHGLNK